MSDVPPAPPPLPPRSLDLSSSSSPLTYYINRILPDTGICKWATDHPDLSEACAKYNICEHVTPFRYKYKYFPSIIQVGPTCGLVALSMLLNGDVSPDKILDMSQMEGYSSNGEMFSCKNMVNLTKTVFSLAEIENVSFKVEKGNLYSDEIVEKLLNGAVLLVPYDADCNHSPTLKKGHTAHWALICGVVIIKDPGDSHTSTPGNVYVFSKHGKSKYLAVWKLEDLDRSNRNLSEFSPKKGADGLVYLLPEGGIGGEDGLREQFLIYEGL